MTSKEVQQGLSTQPAFCPVLAAAGRSDEISDDADVYGFLVGSWDLDVRRYAGVDASRDGVRGELHAAWVLEGRAIQDVWIMPERSARHPALPPGQNMYGTTLRLWDPALSAWRIHWSNPAGNHYEQQIGRRIGSDIVQVGTRANGVATRWRFVEITADSFHWLGDALQPDGTTWTLEGEFLARRVR
jgi:hypothetical protein